jgi:hypothetical protein
MSKINFPKKQEQRLIPKYLLEYSEELVKNHPDPSEDWGGGGGSPIEAGTGIIITGDEIKTISVDDESVAMVANLAPVAFSGSYNDLSNKPTIPTKTSELTNDSGYLVAVTWNDIYNKPTFATVAISGDYNDLTNKPTIPTNTSDLTNDSGFITNADLPTNYVTTNTTQSITGAKTFTQWLSIDGMYSSDDIRIAGGRLSIYDNDPSLSYYLEMEANRLLYTANNNHTVSVDFNTPSNDNSLSFPDKSGTLAVTSDIPTVPTNVSSFTNDAGYITGITSSMITTALGYTPGTSNFSGSYNDLTNKPSIPTATSDLTNDSGFITGITSSDVTTALGYTPGTSNFSGDYDDLTDKPTIPTVNDNTITITQGGVTKGSFTLNQSTNQTINVDDVPGMVGEVLYDNASGSTDLTLTMNHSFADYSYVDIQWINNDSITNSTRIYEPNGKTVNLLSANIISTLYIDKGGIYSLSGTTMTQVSKGQGIMVNGDNSIVDYKDNTQISDYIKITKVIGYKQNNAPIVIPTTATSVSTVTPTTTQLVFTYTDNTTETVTLMTGASVSTTTTIS